MNPFENRPQLNVELLTYTVTEALEAAIPRYELDNLMVKANEARANRMLNHPVQEMYMIRFIHPSSGRLVVCVCMEHKGQRQNFLAYYDEIEHLMAEGWATGDIKKLPGQPF